MYKKDLQETFNYNSEMILVKVKLTNFGASRIKH